MKKAYLLLLLLIYANYLYAYTHTINGITYSVNASERTATVVASEFSVYEGDIVIPENISSYSNKCTVVAIGDDAFSYAANLTSITFGDNITSIGANAFFECTGLTSFTIPSGVKNINAGAFAYCTGLTTIVIPENVETIGREAFRSCTNIVSIELPNNLKVLEQDVFCGCIKLANVNIPENLEKIEPFAFDGCRSLTSISLPNSLNSLGNGAFSGCSGLNYVKLPIGLSIGKWTFSGCSSLTSINIHTDEIGEYAFSDCYNLTNVVFSSVSHIAKGAFSGCGFSSIIIPESTDSIDASAFANCTNLEYVELNSNRIVNRLGTWRNGDKRKFDLPTMKEIFGTAVKTYVIGDNVYSVYKETFQDCDGLVSVVIGKNVRSIGKNAFSGCSSLTSITIPSSVEKIEGYAFDKYLKSVYSESLNPASIAEGTFPSRKSANLYVPVNVVSTYKQAEYWKEFKNILSIEGDRIMFDDATVKALCVQNWDANSDGELSKEEAAAVTDIGSVFQNKSNITSFHELQYFTGLTSIPNQAFGDCTNLSSIVIPANVKSIGGWAFNNCNNLTELSMPESITSIGNGVLSSCGNITSVTLPSGITMIPEAAFWGCSKLASITIPAGVTSIGASAFRECKALTEIVIPGNVVSIGTFAFSSCFNLSTITVGEKVETIANNSFLNCAPKKVTVNSNTLVSKNYSTSSSLADLFTDKVESYVLGSNITKIGDYAFYKCFQLREITLPSVLTYIGVNAFNYCNYLSSIVIPSSVTFLGAGAFNYCSGLTSVTVGWATPLAIGETDFSNRKNATLNVPQGSVSAYKAADYWKEFKNITSGTNVIDLSTATVELSYSESSFSYSGKQIKPTVTSVKINGSAKNISDFNITYGENVNAGNGAIYLNGKNDELYTGTATITFTIGQRDISNATVSDIPAYAYTGSPIQPTFTVTDGNPNIITTNDYSVSYSNNTDPGEATITLTGKNNYKGTKLASFTITSQSEGTDLSTANVELSYSEISFSYIGKQIKPTVTSITVNGATKNVSDFNLTYGDNINAGNGTIFISGKNGDLYSGTATVSFVIYPRHINTVTVSSIPTQEYTGSPIEPTFTVTDGNPSIITTNDYTISYSNNIEPGEATITLTGKNNYKATKKVTFTISQTIIVIDPNDVVVTGVPETVLEGQDPDISKISVSYKEERLIRNLDYEISVNKPNKTITITFIGKYSGQITYNYTEVHVEKIAFADATVKTLCVQYWDTNGDGELSIEEAASVTSIDGVFAYNTSINTFEELQYFTGLKQIGSSAFSDCSGLTSITLPTSIERIERFAFSGCVGITSLSIPEGVQFIGTSAFENCSGISVLNLGDNVNTIEEDAFRNCSSLTAMVIPNGVTTIEPRTFQYCENLTTVVIPNAVTTIGERAFDGCKALTTATLPGSLKTIGGDAFTDCMFKSVVIPEGVISIGSRAFYHCTSLTSLTLPNSLTEIGYSAFQFASLKNIISNIENPFVIESSVFSTSNYNTATLNVPVGTIEKYRSTAAWNKFVNITDGSTGINGIYDSTSSDEKYYNANGIRQSNLKKGLNIVKSENGQTKKIIIK